MAVTLQNLRDIFYWILRENENTSAYPLVLADSFINLAQKKICRGKVVNPLKNDEVIKWQLAFINKEVVYENVAVVYATDDAVSWATVIEADTTEFQTTGSLYINGYVVTYTGKTSTTFTGCSGVISDILSGTQISICYALPSDFASSINLIYNNKVKVRCVLYDDIFEELNNYKLWDAQYYNNVNTNSTYPSVQPFYTIKDDQYLILFNFNSSGTLFKLRYQRNPDSMSESTDTCLITDDDYAKSTIPYLAVGEMLYNRWEEQRAADIINFALGNIREMYSHYNKSSLESISWTKYKVGKSMLNI